jgi:hypothetical protein
VGHVRLDRVLAQDELARDLRVGQAAGDGPQHVELALREPGERAGTVPRAGRGARANSAMSLRVTDGASSASPAAATRTASSSRSAGASLSRNPLAPRRSAAVDVLVAVEGRQQEHGGVQRRVSQTGCPHRSGTPHTPSSRRP